MIWTIASALEFVSGQFDPKDMDEIKVYELEPVDYLKEKLGINPLEGFILALLINEDDLMTVKEMARRSHITTLRMLTKMPILESMVGRRLIQHESKKYPLDGVREGYIIHPDCLRAILDDQKYEPCDPSTITPTQLMDTIEEALQKIEQSTKRFSAEVKHLRNLFKETTHLSFSKYLLSKYAFLDDTELMLILIAARDIVRGNKTSITSEDYKQYFDDEVNLEYTLDQIKSFRGKIGQCQLIHCSTRDGLVLPEEVELTEKACVELLHDYNVHQTKATASLTDHRLKGPESVKPKQLFYNPREDLEISRLAKMLSQEEFPLIQERMRKANMRAGFACLFYGSPGTGKTETVLQLCRQTGRPLFEADISQLKSEYVGQSEKLVQSLFDEYAKMVKQCEVCPILLFNEADAVISKRTTHIRDSVDKMENALQNIILQAMERLEGIMIATTNLTENMDSAFERRFLYKVRFDKPSVQAKASIWRSMLPTLTSEDADRLAESYSLSGGQIENVARKEMVDSILFGTHMPLSGLMKLCEQESITNPDAHRAIGFK